MKKLCFCLLAACLLACGAWAEEAFDPLAYARGCLTEVFGYTEEQAAGFVFSDDGEGTLTFWPDTRPDLQYALRYDEDRRREMTSPFSTLDWVTHPGEGVLRDVLRRAEAERWFSDWGTDASDALLRALSEADTLVDAAVCSGLTAGDPAAQAVNALFTFLCGPEYLWPAPLSEWRDETLARYGLALPDAPTPAVGVRRAHYGRSDAVTFACETPEELRAAFDRPELAGWKLLCGSYRTMGLDNSRAQDKGLAAFEKDGRRLLTILAVGDNGWEVWPVGENALYPDADFTIECDRSVGFFAIVYTLSDHETAVFHVYPDTYAFEGARHMSCTVSAYLRADGATGEQFMISSTVSQPWHVWTGRIGGPMTRNDRMVRYPAFLGGADVRDFPTTGAEAEAVNVFPEAMAGGSLVMANGVHLRAKTSSRSADLGMLRTGVLLPVLDVKKGSEAPWIHTRLGRLEGYVSSNYTSYGQDAPSMYTPVRVAKAKGDIPLKKGAGLLDGTARTLPAGTKMHILLEDGKWFYVSVPRGEMDWLPDLNGDFGYVKKADVIDACLPCQLDWLGEP